MLMTLIQMIESFRRFGWTPENGERDDVTVCSRCNFRVVGRAFECNTCGLAFLRHGRCSDSLVDETDLSAKYH